LNDGRLDRAFVLSGAYVLGRDEIEGPDEYSDVEKENNYLAIQCAKYPEKLIGFFSVNPLKDYAIKEVDRCYDELNLPGLKLYFRSNSPEFGKKDAEILINEVIAKTPGLKIQIAHLGG
jgi:predicted TIM-barrel fold metal-dependent hydrolase